MCNLLQQVAQPQDDSITFIYGLVDPNTGYIRYVGKANNPKYRLRMHLTPGERKDASHKNSWLRSLLSKGQKPEIIILERTSQSEWKDIERKWIAYYRALPHYPRLTNVLDGGEGVVGYILSAEQKRMRSYRQKGVPMPPGTGDKIRAALKGFVHTDQSRVNMSNGKKKQWANLSEDVRTKICITMRSGITEESRKKARDTNRNLPKSPLTSSIYLGVTRIPKKNPWCASCTVDGKRKHLGVFATEEEAARARDRFVVKHISESVRLNFPRSDYG